MSILLFWGLLMAGPAPAADPESAGPWAVYYSDAAPLQAFERYKLLVLDSDQHPPIEPLAERGKMLLGYISLGEVENYRSYYGDVKSEEILFDENPHWKGSYFVDVRSPLWTKRVIEELVPDILRQGFDGLFLDTLDNPPHLERVDPEKYRGMTEAAAVLIRTLRRNYPSIPIMMNRGYELIPHVGNQIDFILGESVYADYDFDKKVYRRVPTALYEEQVRILKAAKTRFPRLRIFTLDYWDPKDRREIADIYRVQRENGFEPYVSTVALDTIVLEPRR